MRQLLLFLLLSTAVARAAEVDQFSPAQPQQLQDSSAVIEREVMRRMERAVKLANSPYPRRRPYKVHAMRRRPQCDQERLYDSLRWYLARPVIGQIETFAERSPLVEKRRVGFRQSIYQDFPWQQSPSLVLSERLAAVIRIGQHDVGSDKLGHFFTEGSSYFEITNRLSDGVNAGLLFGDWSESLYFGAQTTGVFSFADLVANYQGLRFWNRILAQQPDPLLGHQPEPYIRCDNQRWRIHSDFLFADYIDAGWNESINCIALRTPALLKQVAQHGPSCQPRKLPKQRYQAVGQRLLNTQGLSVLAEHLQPEALLPQRIELENWRLPNEAFEHIRDVREWLEDWRTEDAAP